jgi:DNA-binding NarL/FixJ family response regulator
MTRFEARTINSHAHALSDVMDRPRRKTTGAKRGRPPKPKPQHFSELHPSYQSLLHGLIDGKEDKQIAFEMGISEDTVHSYHTRLRKKLGGMTNRAQLIAWAFRHGYSPANTEPATPRNCTLMLFMPAQKSD